jgi:DNA-binding beta-propeller fold protein YncE
MPTVVGGGRWVLDGGINRRTLLKAASGAAIASLVAACAPSSSSTSTSTPTSAPAAAPTARLTSAPAASSPIPGSPVAAPSAAASSPVAIASASPSSGLVLAAPGNGPTSNPYGGGPETVYVFNVASKDVTIIDAASRQATGTKPLGSAVRWLSNEQSYWDGQMIWTYDFPDNKLQAIAIDPREVSVARTINDLGTGPGHSLMLLPDRKTAAINVAGDNVIAVIDVASGQIKQKLSVGSFPCDLHYTPDGRYAFTPERDQDTVSKIDMQTWQVVKTVKFPDGTKPHMLRVSPDGKEVWVQTANANTNSVLSVDDLSTLAEHPVGKTPVTNAWTPDGRYAIITNSGDTFASVWDAKTFAEVARLSVGQGGSNIGYTKDGNTAFISVTGANAVAVVDVPKWNVASQIKAGNQPQGLIVL